MNKDYIQEEIQTNKEYILDFTKKIEDATKAGDIKEAERITQILIKTLIKIQVLERL